MKALIQSDQVIDVRNDADPLADGTYVSVPPFVRPGYRLIADVWCRSDGTPLTADERRWFIAPRTVIERITPAQLKGVLASILGVSPDAISDQRESMFRLVLTLATTDRVLSDGIGAAALPAIFGQQEADRILAPDPNAPA